MSSAHSQKEDASSLKTVFVDDEEDAERNAVRSEACAVDTKTGSGLFVKTLADFQCLSHAERVVYMNLLRALMGEDKLSAETPARGFKTSGPPVAPAGPKKVIQHKKPSPKVGHPHSKVKKTCTDAVQTELQALNAESRNLARQLKQRKGAKGELVPDSDPLVQEFQGVKDRIKEILPEKESKKGIDAAKKAGEEG